jgi:hypothetical protein
MQLRMQKGIKRLQIIIMPLFALFTFVFVIYSILMNSESINTENLAHLFILYIYVLYLLSIIITEYYKNNITSHLALFSSAMLLYFGVFGILYYDEAFYVNPKNRVYYLGAIILVMCYTIIYHITSLCLEKFLSFRNKSNHREVMWSSNRTFLVVIVILVLGFFGRALIFDKGLYLQMAYVNITRINMFVSNMGVIRFLERLPDIAAWIAWIHYLYKIKTNKRTNIKLWKTLSITLIIISIVYWIPTGKKYYIVQALITPLIIWYMTFKIFPKFKYVLIAFLLILVMFPATHIYRLAQVKYLGETEVVFSFSKIINVIENTFSHIVDVHEVGAQNRTFGRLNEIEVVSGSIRLIEDDIASLKWGKNYIDGFVNLVPRIIWPDKPYVFYGNEFGHLIGMISNSDNATSIAPTLIGEAYLNFRIFGVFVAAFIAFIFHVLNKQEIFMSSSETGKMLYVIAIPTLLYIDASFALYFSALFQLWVFVFVLCWFMQTNKYKYLLKK